MTNTGVPMYPTLSSEMYVKDPDGAVKQKALIYMNHPLRYGGLTFYQASFANEDTTSIFQVVKNPGWMLPYLSVLHGIWNDFRVRHAFLKFLKKEIHNEATILQPYCPHNDFNCI